MPIPTIEMEHQKLVKKLCKSGKAIADEITPLEAHALHMAVGISGESGELLDQIKKFVMYKKPLDMQNVVEEMGDLEFYMEGLRQAFGLKRADILTHNYEKLSKRYDGQKYSDKSAIDRADKQNG